MRRGVVLEAEHLVAGGGGDSDHNGVGAPARRLRPRHVVHHRPHEVHAAQHRLRYLVHGQREAGVVAEPAERACKNLYFSV